MLKGANFDIHEEIKALKLDLEKTKNKDLSTQLNYIKYLNGKFKSKLNSYHGCLIERAKLMHKINSGEGVFKFDKFGLNLNNLSNLEFYLLKNPTKLKKVINISFVCFIADIM